MKQLIACCGLDCEECEARIATVRNDDALRTKVACEWSKLNNADILPEHINCMGCRAEGLKTMFCSELCDIRRCVLSKGFATCGDCDELHSCPIVGRILQYTPTAKDNLTR